MSNPQGPLTASVVAHEAKSTPGLPDEPVINDAMVALATACNGFPYHGADIEAQIRAVRFLRARPDVAVALGLSAARSPN